MKVIIAGSRTLSLSVDLIDQAVSASGFEITELVNGGARGVDASALAWAIAKGVPFRIFRADWDMYGKGAGHIRNKAMAEYGDALIVIGHEVTKGTNNMWKTAGKLGLERFPCKVKIDKK